MLLPLQNHSSHWLLLGLLASLPPLPVATQPRTTTEKNVTKTTIKSGAAVAETVYDAYQVQIRLNSDSKALLLKAHRA
ncbi:hypothetical protein [Hymenobacter sp.]|uniref:hypothetical protein n=1 Tax=Hymenobacter sp. TaxID=1898978 RepID=UPI002ED780AE